ncbi:type II secretion system protein [Psychrobacillus sp. NPDC093200]|uniref:type IV pilus modification PilV family protein n=1 Tax=Psychrobacillus sp. NPDC093200 TaxID=3390656 RepID=UPI0018A215B5
MFIHEDIHNEKGLTLVELLVAIIIVTIILLSFLTFFLQSAKTGKSSEKIVDATYLAQTEMERFYELSVRIKNSDRILGIENLGYSVVSANTEEEIFEKADVTNNGFIKVKLKLQSKSTSLYHLVIEVYDNKEGPLRVKMENIIEWR